MCTCVDAHTNTPTHQHTNTHTHTHTHTHRARWVKIGGVLYKTPCALLVELEDDYPQFGKLKEILILNSKHVFFHVSVMKTLLFLSHYNAYSVSTSSLSRVIHLTDLHSPFPLHTHHITIPNNTTQHVIVLKYHVSGCLY